MPSWTTAPFVVDVFLMFELSRARIIEVGSQHPSSDVQISCIYNNNNKFQLMHLLIHDDVTIDLCGELVTKAGEIYRLMLALQDSYPTHYVSESLIKH